LELIILAILCLLFLILLYLAILPFIKGFKEGIERYNVKKELIKKFEE